VYCRSAPFAAFLLEMLGSVLAAADLLMPLLKLLAVFYLPELAGAER
jgi:hypothetical protein